MSYPSETETLKQFAVRCTMSDQHWRQMTGSGTGRQTNASIFKRDPKFLEIKSRACTHLGGIQLTALECRELKMTSGITQRMGRICFFNTEHYIFYIWLPRKPTLHGGKKHERHNLRSERVLVAVLPWAQTSTAQGKQWFSVDIGWPSLQVLCAHCFGTIQSLHVSPFVWGPSGANAEVSWDLLSRWRVVTCRN